MFVRRKLNKSGSISIQIVKKSQGRNSVVCTVGCSGSGEDLKRLEAVARSKIEAMNPQLRFDFGVTKGEREALRLLEAGEVRSVGPDLILGKIFDRIGFNSLPDPLFKEIVLARLVYPTSKLKTTEYLLQHQGKDIHVDRVYRFLDRLSSKYKAEAERIAFNYTKQILGVLTVVFYDMTTLYFEAETEDDFRKVGFSKDGKFQHPQIMIGLLVGHDGYPIAYDIFEGNRFEGSTLLPALKNVQERFSLSKLTVVADSGLLSKDNIKLLQEHGYTFILGARIKNESKLIQDQILEKASKINDKGYFDIQKQEGLRLIVDYSLKRAKKDAHNRQKGIARLYSKIRSGTLTKQSLNNRGYNKFLTLEGTVTVKLNSQKVEHDALWDGLKGYVTNSVLSPSDVIKNYRQLWKIEKAFRISKTDLRIRPIFHRKRSRIEAHICVAFVAYTVFKELERLLIQHNIPMSPQKALELMRSIYQFSVFLPESKKIHSSFIGLSETQRSLLTLI